MTDPERIERIETTLQENLNRLVDQLKSGEIDPQSVFINHREIYVNSAIENTRHYFSVTYYTETENKPPSE